MSCKTIMCKYDLNDKSGVKKWLLKNHPDKGGKINSDDYSKIMDCYKNNDFCKTNTKKNPDEKKTIKVTKKNRAQIFSCMRKTENFSKIANYHKFDKSIFDPVKLNNELSEASPKMIQLLNNIKELDEQDVKNHGHKFKHFIFSDVKEGGYGAKIIASALMANGYNNIVKARKVLKQQKMKLYLDIQASNYKNFALLSSNSIYGTTFNEKIKKEVLKTFNERPVNIHGKNVRLIIFDSGFKEGIDLFDVKYVHIFEPSITIADLKQTVGRATRTCGQKGLEFQENVGWPLYVYNYYLTAPDITQETMASSRFLAYNIDKPEKEEKDDDVLIFKNVEKVNDSTMLYSEFDKAMNNLSKQLFELAGALSTDYGLTKNLHNVEDLNMEFMERDFYLKGGQNQENVFLKGDEENVFLKGGGGKSNDVFKKLNRKSKYFSMNVINCKGNCKSRTSNDVPISLDFMKRVYLKYGHPKKALPKTSQRKALCLYMASVPQYCTQLNYEWGLRYAYVPQAFERKNTKKNLDDLELEPTPENDIEKEYPNYEGKKAYVKTHPENSFVPNSKLSFTAMRDFIKSVYNAKEYIWEPLVIENKCIPKKGDQAKDPNEVELNPTQNFVSKFFCPESPYKGLLLWHSVGTGKTCTAIATASSSFERQGYSILWVTRTTLKGDVWKNIFDQICHTIIKEEVRLGLTIPENISDRKKLLSNSWIEPMSYKQFSNLLAGKNKIYQVLVERNGKTDLLKKTLIIIDEAHKLYGGDLKAAERPNMAIMEKLISNSYKVSGNNSCKLLIMTATPFTNSPLELFSLTNMFLTNESEKITTDKEEFKKQYMTNENILSESAVKNLANKLSGYISYLNREKDATQFAQPIMINVPILMTHIDNEELRDAVYLNTKFTDISKDAQELIDSIKLKVKTMKANYKTKKQQYKETKSTLSKEEANVLNEELIEIMEKIKKLQEELENNKYTQKASKDTVKELKAKIKRMKDSLIQEYILFTKCKHLKYKQNTTRKLPKLLK